MNQHIPDDLLVKFFEGNASKEEIELVEQWKNKSIENEIHVNESRIIWEKASQSTPKFSPNTEEALKRVNQQISKTKTISFKPYFPIAAALAIAVTALIYLQLNQKETIWETLASADQKAFIELEDGSKVWLNKNTTLKYPASFNKKHRTIKFEGEAYFEIAKYADRPFIVEASHTTTKVLGTAFNLRARKLDTVVTLSVTEGLVAFSSTNKTVQVKAGQKTAYNSKQNKVQEVQKIDRNNFAWKTGLLEFSNTPLLVAIKDIEALHEVKINTRTTSKDSLLLNGTFKEMDITATLKAIALSLGVEIVKKDSNSYSIN